MEKILIVDDVGIVRYRLSTTLARHGYPALAEASGPTAMKLLLEDAAIMLVITDGAMTNGSGLDFVRACQKLERHNDHDEEVKPRVVLMTMPEQSRSKGSHVIYSAGQATSFGFIDVLEKPISEPALLKCVQKHLTAPAIAVR